MNKFYLHLKHFKLSLFLIVGLIFSANQIQASHLVGSDISYQCTSTPGIYKVSMKIYRDCAGIPLCSPGCTQPIPNGTVAGCTTATSGWATQILGASPACLGINFGSFTLQAVSGTSGIDIIQTCASLVTICTNCQTRTPGTFSPGIEVYTYEGNVDLTGIPASCCKVTLGANTCCRNGALTTIVPGSFQTICEVNLCQTPCNSAPTFTNDAATIVCAGSDFVYNLGAIDPDGDSLSYAFGQSLQGVGNPVQYVAPYTAAYPFPYFGSPNQNAALPAGLHIDPLTGDVLFRPMGNSVSNLVIEVTQWKLISGVWTPVGVTRRDVQFQVRLCTDNITPVIKVYRNGVLSVGSNAFTVCAGQQICLDIAGVDIEKLTNVPPIYADTTDMKWNNPGQFNPAMANATFVRNYILSQRGIQGPKSDSFKFCWTPPVNAARSQPHQFTVTVSDRFCPLRAVATKGINITVVAIPTSVRTVVDNKCGFRTFNFVHSNPSACTLNPAQSQWLIEQNPNELPGTETYVAAVAVAGSPNAVYKHYFNKSGTYKYKLKLNSTQPSPLGCPSVDSGTVFIPEPLKVTVRDTFNCYGTPVKVKAVGTGGNRLGNKAGYQFFQGQLNSQVSIQGNLDPNVGAGITYDSFVTVNPINIGNNTVYKVKIRDNDPCYDSVTFNVFTRALPLRELTPKIRLCEGDDTSFFVGANGGIPILKSYWYIAPNLTLALDSFPTYTKNKVKYGDSATYILKKTDVFGCTIYDTSRLYVNVPVNFTPPKDSVCQDDPTFALKAKYNTMFIDSFNWYNLSSGTNLIKNDSIAILLPTATAGTTLYKLRGYQTYDGKTCFSDDTASLKINGLPNILIRPQPVPLCSNQGLYNLGSVQTSNPASTLTTQVWSYPPNPNAITSAGNVIRIDSLQYLPGTYVGKAFGNYVYLSVKAKTTGCYRKDSVILGIFPVTPVNINGPPKFCDFDKSYALSNLTKFNPSGAFESWYGRGVSYDATNNKYYFTPSDTNNVTPGLSVRAGTTLATDSNILTYEFNRVFGTTVQVAFFPARTGTISMSVPAAGCPSSDTVLFRVTKSPKLRAGILPTVCIGADSVMLSSRALAGTNSTSAANPNTSYWYFAAPNKNLKAIARGQVFMPFHPDIVVPNDGQNTYSLVYADTATGCRAADTVNIRVNGTPNVSILTSPLSDSAVCQTQGKILFNLSPSPQFLAVSDSISLSGAPNLSAAIGQSTAYLDVNTNTALLEQAYNIKYYYRSTEGCVNTATKTVRIQFPPDVQLSKNGSACEYGGQFTINVLKSPSSIHPYNLSWSVVGGTGTIVSSDNTKLVYAPTAAEKAAGKVDINIITTNNGLCPAASDNSTFTIYPKPTATFSGVDSGCVRNGKPLNITLTAGPNAIPNCEYIWKVDGVTAADSIDKTVFTKSLSTPKDYLMQLIVYNPITGCVDTAAVQTSTAWVTPIANFEPDKLETTIAKPYFSFKNTTSPLDNNTYLWDISVDPQTLVKRTSSLVHLSDINFIADTAEIPITLTAISNKGCIDSITKYIRINPDITVFIPNVFYPPTNNKGGSQMTDCLQGGVPCNKHFFVQAHGFETIEIYVYNRWGKLVFETKDVNIGWDGIDQKAGGECQQDAYVYQIFATSYSGKKYQYSGSVTLLR